MWIVGLGKLALFFVSTGFLAAGIFLLPMIAGREPPRQHWLAYALLVALAVVVFGSLIGEFISIHGGWRYVWQWFGSQGFESCCWEWYANGWR